MTLHLINLDYQKMSYSLLIKRIPEDLVNIVKSYEHIRRYELECDYDNIFYEIKTNLYWTASECGCDKCDIIINKIHCISILEDYKKNIHSIINTKTFNNKENLLKEILDLFGQFKKKMIKYESDSEFSDNESIYSESIYGE